MAIKTYEVVLDIMEISTAEDNLKSGKTIFSDAFTFDPEAGESPFTGEQLRKITELVENKKAAEAVMAAWCYGHAAGQLNALTAAE